MIVMYILWMLIKRPGLQVSPSSSQEKRRWHSDLVNVNTVDLSRDEYQDEEEDKIDDETRHNRITKGNPGTRALWRLFYVVA